MDTEKILSIIRETREMVLPYYGNVEFKTKDHAADFVTDLDHKVELFLKKNLEFIDPKAGFVGEEFGGKKEKRFWLCDPIDGTGHFVRGLPFCTTMLAFIDNGEVTFGAIYDFVNDQMYHAERGKGAYQNGEPIRVSERSIEQSYVSWETHLDKQENLEKFIQLEGVTTLVKFLASGYGFVMIASGKIEGHVSFDPWGKEWDSAPGSLLVEEAGGKVANLGKTTYDYQNLDFIAANKSVFASLTESKKGIFKLNQ